MATVRLNLNWQITGMGDLAYAEYGYTSGAGVDTEIYIGDALTRMSDKPIRARAVEITVNFLQNAPQTSAYADIKIDNKPIRVYGRYRANIDGEKVLFISSNVTNALTIKFYSLPLFEFSREEAAYLAQDSNNGALQVITAFATNPSGTQWVWDTSGTFPYNDLSLVSTPKLLRVADPARSHVFKLMHGLTSYNPDQFPLFWGTDPNNCTVPFRWNKQLYTHQATTTNIGIGGCPFNVKALSAAGKTPIYKRFPIDERTADTTISSQFTGNYFSDMIPKSDIWVCCVPTVSPSGAQVFRDVGMSFLIN
jgi:hypothetical protein